MPSSGCWPPSPSSTARDGRAERRDDRGLGSPSSLPRRRPPPGALEAPARGPRPSARPRPLVWRRRRARLGPVSRPRDGPGRPHPGLRALHGDADVRGGALPRGDPPGLRAAWLVSSREPGHEVRHGGGLCRLRCARQEPSPRRLLRRIRGPAGARDGRRSPRGVRPGSRARALSRHGGRHGTDGPDHGGDGPPQADRDAVDVR